VAFFSFCASAGLALVAGQGDLLITAPYAVLTALGLISFTVQHQRRAEVGAIFEERRRIARDLHDGLAQELAYISMEASRLATRDPDGRAGRLVLAAHNALEESRGAITALRGDEQESFAGELSAVARGIAARSGAELSVDVDPGLEVEPEDRHALIRIMREALSNGVRHGHATELKLEVSGADGVRMAVRDNGAGFVPGAPRRRGSFGLTSMHERAHALGGNLDIQSAPGQGTLVEVKLP
jgi:signal transduction histidine kinase